MNLPRILNFLTKETLRLTILIIIITSYSCKRKEINNYFIDPVTKKETKIQTLQIDTISFENIESSFTGTAKIKHNKIYFIDSRFCWAYVFNREGRLISKHLGQGGGPNELNTGFVDSFEPMKDGSFILVGTADDYHIFDSLWVRKKVFTIDRGTNEKEIDLVNKKNINGSMKWVYTKCYNKLIYRNYKNYLFYNIYCDHPNYNMATSSDYFKNGRIIAKMNVSNGVMEEILGRLSPVYQKYTFIGQFALTSFDISNIGDFYVCFEADPTIYVYDKNFNIKNAFGIVGRDMKTSYKEINTIQMFKEEAMIQRQECGYYSWVEYIDEVNLLFRSYTKGSIQPYDGIQIYNDNVLIGDVDVPKNFKVIGYIAPYFYSDIIIDEEKETMKMFRFKID